MTRSSVFSTAASAARICRTSAVSMMSCVVAPKWTSSAAAPPTCSRSCRTSSITGTPSSASRARITPRSGRKLAAFWTMALPDSAGITPSLASALASAVSTASISATYRGSENIAASSSSVNSEPSTAASFASYGLKKTVSRSPCRWMSIR